MAIDVEPHVLSRRRIGTVIGVVAVIIAAAAAIVYDRRRPVFHPPPPVHLAFTAPAGVELGAGDEPLDAAIAPDGARIAFVATRNGITQLWLRSLDSDVAQPLPDTEGAQLPAWKPTGRVIAFFAGNHLKQIALPNGPTRDLADALAPAGTTWLPDGSLLFAASTGAIHRLRNGAISDVTSLHRGDRSHAFPVSTGSGDGFVYVATRDNGQRVIRLVENGQEHELTEAASHGQLVDGTLLYVRDNVLFARALDRKTLTLTGATSDVANNVGVSSTGRGLFTASPRLLLTSAAAMRARVLTWLDANGMRLQTSGEPGDYWQVRLSQDDREAAVTVLAPLIRTLDVWSFPLAPGELPRQLTLSLSADSDPVWSDDGTRVLFRSLQSGTANLYTHAVRDPKADDQIFMKSELDETPTDWRGADVLFQAPRPGTGLDVWHFDSTSMEIEGVATTAFNESDARWSPDADWVAYVSDESGRSDVYAQPWPYGDRVRVSTGGGSRPRWGRNGELYFMRGDQMMRSDPQDSDEMPFSTPRPAFEVPRLRDYDLAHNSDRFLALLPVTGGAQPAVVATIDWERTR